MTNPSPHPKTAHLLAKRVLERIETERVSPRPRWEFLFKDYFFWSLGAFAVILGALAISAMLFELSNVDWRFAPVTHDNLFSFFLDIAPVLWVAALALFVLIGYMNIRRTNHGYRYPLSLIAVGAVCVSGAIGGALYMLGLGRSVENTIGDYPPFHRPIMAIERDWWMAPGRGLLGGEIIHAASDESSFTLRDFKGVVWEIDAGDVRGHDLAVIARGGTVRVAGAAINGTTTTNAFHACFVMPWGGDDTQLPPPPLALVASTSERNQPGPRSDFCKGIRPYQQLRSIDGDGL